VTSLDHLLPEADEQVRCSEFARQIAIDPGGTAIRADRVVLVETGLPWPKPVFDHPTLLDIDPLFKNATRLTRLLACQPDDDPATKIWVFDRLARSTRERRFSVTTPDELLDLSACLSLEESGESPTVGSVHPNVDETMDDQVVLICTQGSHDVCCGSDGARLALAAEADSVARRIRVFRVSHTGGHRFAPTAMTLPNGRMWAYLVPELLDEVLTGTGDPGPLASYCRGWWGADKGPAQVAERAVFAKVGFAADRMARSVVEAGPDTYTVTVGLETGPVSWTVDLSLLREVPTIACRAPGGLPTKTGREYEATIRP